MARNGVSTRLRLSTIFIGAVVFFQAEDGIRDWSVTGVQTCALPIYVELLARVDEAHETLSGPATRRVLEREFQHYGKAEYQRLASISVAHLYNLRQQPRYRERRLHYVTTKPTAVTIGERRRPDPQGQPGYLRVDSVHQGDQPGAKGVFHINAVDQVTQWQIVSASARLSEAWLEPVLAAMIRQFPFRILGFHSDNGKIG